MDAASISKLNLKEREHAYPSQPPAELLRDEKALLEWYVRECRLDALGRQQAAAVGGLSNEEIGDIVGNAFVRLVRYWPKHRTKEHTAAVVAFWRKVVGWEIVDYLRANIRKAKCEIAGDDAFTVAEEIVCSLECKHMEAGPVVSEVRANVEKKIRAIYPEKKLPMYIGALNLFMVELERCNCNTLSKALGVHRSTGTRLLGRIRAMVMAEMELSQ